MRRAIAIVAIGLFVFALAALAGFVTAARIAPARLQASAERQLSELADATVKLGTVDLAFGENLPWMNLQAIDARISWPSGGAFEAERLSASLNPISLIFGRLDLRDLELDGARALIPDWETEAEPDLSSDIAWLAEQAARLRREPCLGPKLEIRGLAISQTLDGEVVPLIRDAHGQLLCHRLGFQGEVHLEGDLQVAANETTPVRIELGATSGEVGLVISMGEIPISRFAEALSFDTGLRGRFAGTARWRMPDGGPQFLDLNLRGRNISGTLGSPERPALDLALERPRLRVHASGNASQLDIRFAELEDGGVSIAGDGAFGLPLVGRASMRARLSVDELSRDDVGHLIAQLPPVIHNPTNRVHERIESGTLAHLEVALRTTKAGFEEIMRSGPLARPGELSVAMEFREAVLRAGATDQLTGLSGHLRFDGDRFEVSGLTARYGERRLEQIDAAIVGLAHLRHPDDFQCVRPAHVDTLPGLDSFTEWRTSRSIEGAPPSWQRLRLELDRVAHPVLLCEIADVAATLEPDVNGLDASVAHAIWAGLPIEANATYRESESGERVVLTATVGAPVGIDAIRPNLTSDRTEAQDPVPELPADPASLPWARGRFEIEANHIGTWQIRGASGRVMAHGTQVELQDTQLLLAPAGSIEGDAEIELGAAGAPFYEAAVEVADVPLQDLWASAGLEGGMLSGHLHGALAVSGKLHPNENPLAHASGAVALHARTGEIHQQIPIVLAVVMAGDRFAPFQDRDRIPYDAIDLSGRMSEGRLEIINLTLTSPDVRGAASGTLDFAEDAELAMVVGIFFFPRLDGLIQKIPLLNRVVLGRNRNLVGAYFSLDGPIGSPAARVVPLESLAQGGAGMVLALPAFVVGGIQRIQSMVIPRTTTREADQNEDS